MDTMEERTISVLNDLILINSERSTAYEKAMKQIVTDDPGLAQVFKVIAADSRKYLYELAGQLDPSGQEFIKVIPPASGQLYQEWVNEKRIFPGKDRQALLDSCEFGETAISKAYEEALRQEITGEVKRLIAEQKNDLCKAHDKIRELQQLQHV